MKPIPPFKEKNPTTFVLHRGGEEIFRLHANGTSERGPAWSGLDSAAKEFFDRVTEYAGECFEKQANEIARLREVLFQCQKAWPATDATRIAAEGLEVEEIHKDKA